MRKIDKDQVVASIERANPWWKGGSVGGFRDLPKRSHFKRLLGLSIQKDPRRALVILGPRRIGKTVLLYQIIDKLMIDGRSPKSLMYVSLDNPVFRLSSLHELLYWGFEWAGSKLEGATVFFDEIQYVEGWEQQLKSLVDSHGETKFIVTGSAAADLQKKSKESGAGRFSDYLLPPLSFFEYIAIKGEIEQAPDDSIDLAKLNDLYLEYLNFGGFPESITSPAVRRQPEVYIGQDILDKVLGKDLPSAFGITNPNELQRLFAALAYNTSNEVSLEAISNQSGVSKNEINKYIGFLESAFLIRVIEKTDDTLKRFQRRTHFKIVLTNPSLRSAIFGPVDAESKDLEALAETAVYSQMIIHGKRFPAYKYARWNRGGSKGEVDLVHITIRGEVRGALEIKWSDRFASGQDKPKSLIAFCADNGLKQAFMTSKAQFSETNYGELKVTHMPTSFLCLVLGMFGTIIDTAVFSAESLTSAMSDEERNRVNDATLGALVSEMKPVKYLKKELASEFGKGGECFGSLVELRQA